MATVFSDFEGDVYTELIAEGMTLTYVEKNYKFEKSKLSDYILLLHDNDRPQAAHKTQTLLQKSKEDVWPQPLYNSDLVPCLSHLLRSMKNDISREHFWNDDELKLLYWIGCKTLEEISILLQWKRIIVRREKCFNSFRE